jgi:ribonuclease Z
MAEKIQVTFLGTGSAVPTERRNHPALLIQYKDENILFDCGEGTQKQFRIAKISACKITRIFISHWHGDHVFGLPGLLQTLALSNYSKTLHVYGPRGTKNYMELYEKLYLRKGESFPLQIHEISSGKVLEEKEFEIQAQEMSHDSPCLAFSFILKQKNRIDKKKLQKLKLPSNSPLIGDLQRGKTIEFNKKKIDGKKLIYSEPQRKVTYIMDTRENLGAIKIAENSNLIISESTYSKDEEEQAKEYAHLTSTQAAEIAKKSKSKQLILMHLSQRYENPKIILSEAKKVFKNTKVAEDFDKLEI